MYIYTQMVLFPCMCVISVLMYWKRLGTLSKNVCACAVRAEVDSYIGIDYSLLSDPVVTGTSLDMDFRVSGLLPVMLIDHINSLMLQEHVFTEYCSLFVFPHVLSYQTKKKTSYRIFFCVDRIFLNESFSS